LKLFFSLDTKQVVAPVAYFFAYSNFYWYTRARRTESTFSVSHTVCVVGNCSLLYRILKAVTDSKKVHSHSSLQLHQEVKRGTINIQSRGVRELLFMCTPCYYRPEEPATPR
jgi:hypothetical protein